ncbi:MAG: phosphopantothenoylcysteine decarboxylase, partial [Candidatus Neomarinimicrobiota bacterium]
TNQKKLNLLKMHFLITAGGTREYIDPVRFVSNASSGRMGYALAVAARDMGAEVLLVSGPVDLPPVAGCRLVEVSTAEEMLAVLSKEAPGSDYLFMAAAVADFRPAAPAAEKIRRKGQPKTLALEPAPDVLATLRGDFDGRIIAFSLQPDADLATAREKLKDKGADYIVVNNFNEPGAAFESETNHVWILSADSTEQEIPLSSKEEVAREILKFVAPAD